LGCAKYTAYSHFGVADLKGDDYTLEGYASQTWPNVAEVSAHQREVGQFATPVLDTVT